MTDTITNKQTSRKPRRMAREPATETSAAAAQADATPRKASIVLTMLGRPEGATIAQMVEATGWQPHTTRAVLTGFRKKGHEVTSEKKGGVRTYRIPADARGVDSASTEARSKVDA